MVMMKCSCMIVSTTVSRDLEEKVGTSLFLYQKHIFYLNWLQFFLETPFSDLCISIIHITK